MAILHRVSRRGGPPPPRAPGLLDALDDDALRTILTHIDRRVLVFVALTCRRIAALVREIVPEHVFFSSVCFPTTTPKLVRFAYGTGMTLMPADVRALAATMSSDTFLRTVAPRLRAKHLRVRAALGALDGAKCKTFAALNEFKLPHRQALEAALRGGDASLTEIVLQNAPKPYSAAVRRVLLCSREQFDEALARCRITSDDRFWVALNRRMLRADLFADASLTDLSLETLYFFPQKLDLALLAQLRPKFENHRRAFMLLDMYSYDELFAAGFELVPRPVFLLATTDAHIINRIGQQIDLASSEISIVHLRRIIKFASALSLIQRARDVAAGFGGHTDASEMLLVVAQNTSAPEAFRLFCNSAAEEQIVALEAARNGNWATFQCLVDELDRATLVRAFVEAIRYGQMRFISVFLRRGAPDVPPVPRHEVLYGSRRALGWLLSRKLVV
jgi:hypothetical protein